MLAMNALKSVLPPAVKHRLRSARYAYQVARRLRGTRTVSCNVCGHTGLFGAVGNPPRYDAVCPSCHSLERHRLLKQFFDARGPEYTRDKDVLHFAPEANVRPFVAAGTRSYRSADLMDPRADVVMDIERIPLPDACLDLIVCLHVLEHVDDARALAELRRVLRPAGELLLMVPLVEGWDRTYEDTAVDTPEARELCFGQCDHVRLFGRDFRQRVQAGGFAVEEFTAEEPFVRRFGLLRGEKVFRCRHAP